MESSVDYLQLLIYPFILSLPQFAVIVIGIGFSIVRYKKYPKVSVVSLISLLILAVIQAFSVIQPLITNQLIRNGIVTESLTFYLGIIGVIISVFGTISTALLIYAIWSGR